MTQSREDALRSLDFGKVDSESETDLDLRFVRTDDFRKFVRDDIWLALGPKGTGKSALFELFAKYENAARDLSDGRLDGVIIAAGTGFGDLSEIATGDIKSLRGENGYDHDRLWRLYIAVRCAMALSQDGTPVQKGPLKDLLRAMKAEPDLRILPLMKSLWTTVVGDAPGEIKVAAGGATITIKGGKRSLDVVGLLQEIQEALDFGGRRIWLLFDKIDEIFPSEPIERRSAIEGLMTACMSIRRQFPAIQPKVLLRTDIWRDLDFTNKSHLSDKRVELRWNREQLAVFLLKRACVSDAVRSLVEAAVPSLVGSTVEALSPEEVEAGIIAIFPETLYPGQREAQILDWVVARVTDAQGTVLPRETIMLGNQAKDLQDDSGALPDRGLLSREVVREAFSFVSQERVSSYLAEFPDVKEHLQRFRGQTTATFSREQLYELFDGLEPSDLAALDRLYEIGVLQPLKGTTVTAATFEVPRLYRVGLGLVIRGRA